MANSVVFPRVQFFANNGRPLIGGRIHTYVAGSSTRARTYKDAAKAQPNANPIILDARGEASVYLAEGVEYKFVIEDSTGALIMTQEPVYGAVWPNAAEWPSDATLSYQYMTEAKAAAGAIGPIKFYDTLAQAQGDIGSLQPGDIIEVAQDETADGARTRYKLESGDLVFVVNLDQVRLDIDRPSGQLITGGFDTYARLRAYRGLGTSVQMGALGTSSTGQGIFGHFYRDDADTTSADNGGTVILDGLGRRWKRQFTGPVWAEWFGANPALTDNTTQLRAWLAAFRTGGQYAIGAGEFRFTDQLRIPDVDSFRLEGAGSQSTVFLYTGTSTIIDLIVYGDGTALRTGSHLCGFTVRSNTAMTAGAGLRMRRVRDGSQVCDVNMGVLGDSVPNLWDGIWFDNVNVCTYEQGKLSARNCGFIVNGSAINDEGSDLSMDRITAVGCEIGYLVGGGFGGIYFGSVLAFANGRSFVVDNSRAARRNREIFFGPSCCPDGCRDIGIHLNDTLTSGGVVYISADGIASAGLTPDAGYGTTSRGHNIFVERWAGRISIGNGQLYNGTGSGLLISDAAAEVRIADGRTIAYNQRYGIESTVQTDFANFNGTLHNNTLGNISAQVNYNRWQQFPIPPIPAVGSFGSATAVVRFNRRGNTVIGTLVIDIASNGTASDSIFVAVPYGPLNWVSMSGYECNVAKKGVLGSNATSGENSIRLTFSDGTYPGADGARIILSFQFETAP